jgi:Protein of unknown function (DUF2958)
MAMKLVTKEILKKLPPLGSTADIPTEDKKVIARFFTPWAHYSWSVVEGEVQPDGDILFFGYVSGNCDEYELGDFYLSQLAEINGPFGMHVERDKLFRGTMGDILRGKF